MLWLATSVALPWWLSQLQPSPFTWLQDREWMIIVPLLLAGVLVYSGVLLPLALKQDQRSGVRGFPTTGSMIAQSSASSEPRARFAGAEIEHAVSAIHQRAPQHDATLRTVVWEWSLNMDEASLSPIEELWKSVDPEGFAKYEAEDDDLD